MRFKKWYPHELRGSKFNKKKDNRVPAVLPPCEPSLWPAMREYLEGRKLDYFLACQNGWYPSTQANDNEARIVIPAVRTDGGIYWQARAIQSKVKKRYQSPRTSREDAIVVVDPTAYTKRAVLVEGPMDALAAASVGILGIALMGNTPNELVLSHVVHHVSDCSRIYVVSDSEGPALQNSTWIAVWLQVHTGVAIKLRSPYPYNDLAAMPWKKREELFS